MLMQELVLYENGQEDPDKSASMKMTFSCQVVKEALTTREVALRNIHMIFMCVCEYTFIML